MKRLYEWEEFENDENFSLEEIKEMFGFLDKIRQQDLINLKPIEFLHSLNLTQEQYDTLRKILDEYAYNSYEEGREKGHEEEYKEQYNDYSSNW